MRSFILCLFSLIYLSAFSTHNRAGQLLYKRIAPFSNNGIPVYTYSFTLIMYTDDGQGIADRCKDTIWFGDGQSAIVPRINGNTTCGCGTGCGEIIYNNVLTIKKNIYTATHTYAQPGIYKAFHRDPYRNAGVANIPNSLNTPFYVEALVVAHEELQVNNSPILPNSPIDAARLATCYFHNLCAYDEDGDSLSYSLTACRNGSGNPVAGYVFPQNLSIDPTTGLLSWCNPTQSGEYNVAVIITEWRRLKCHAPYQVIGYVMRDFQIISLAGSVDVASFTNIPNLCVVAGGNISQTFTVATSVQATLLIANAYSVPVAPPNANLTTYTSNTTFTTTYNLTTACADAARLPYQVNLIASSGSDPKPRFYKSFYVKIVPPAPKIHSLVTDTNTVKIKWFKPACLQNVDGYYIYRKNGVNSWTHAPCENGVPASSGFTLIDFRSAQDTMYLDDKFGPVNDGSIGNYIITTVFKNCAESFADTISTVSFVVGVNELQNRKEFYSVFPNPFNNIVTIHSDTETDFKAELYKTDGTFVNSQQNSNTRGLTLHAENLAKGVYFLRITSPKGITVKKIVKI